MEKTFNQNFNSSAWIDTLLHKHDLNDRFAKKIFAIIYKKNLRGQKNGRQVV